MVYCTRIRTRTCHAEQWLTRQGSFGWEKWQWKMASSHFVTGMASWHILRWFNILGLLYLLMPTTPEVLRYKYLNPVFIAIVSLFLWSLVWKALPFSSIIMSISDSSYAFNAMGLAGAHLSIPALLFGFLIPFHLSSSIWLAIKSLK